MVAAVATGTVVGPPPGLRVQHDGVRPLRLQPVARSGVLTARRLVGGPVAGPLPAVALRSGPVTAAAEALSDYQHLVGATTGDELPAGYVHVLAFPLSLALMSRSDFPLPVLGMVHVANSVTQRRPVRLGEELRFTTWAADLRPHRRGALVDVWLVGCSGAEPVWTGASTYLATGMRVAGEAELAERDPVSADAAATGRHLWRLPADTGRRYAAASGDPNPIHTSRVAARLFGFPRPIAHGMYSAARALAEVRAGAAFTWTVEFAKPVLLPASVLFEFRADQAGSTFVGRSPRSGAVHFSGAVTPV